MCVALPVIAVAAAVAGTAMSAYSMYSSGQAAKKQGEYQAKVAESNAEASRLAGLDAQNRGAQEAADKRQETMRLAARQRAMASGVDPDSGTMEAMQDETQTLGNLDALKVFNNAQREAYGLNIERQNYLSQAAGARMAGADAARAGTIGAASSLLSGASQASYMGYKFNKTGGFK